MKIGVVGAGVSGLASLKFALEAGHDVVCFERTSKLGGCWSGDSKTGKDELGNNIVHGMYKNLTTNLPKEIMVFEGLDYDPTLKSFLGQQDIYKYLKDYAVKYDLSKHIKFGNNVVSIHPLSNDRTTRWKVVVSDLTKNKQLTEYEFDAMMIAPGHFNHKYIAKIKDSELFKGEALHSNEFRDAEHYKGKKVIVIGAGPSGGDIAKRVSEYANKVFQSIKPTSMRFVPVNTRVVEKCEIERFDERGAHFTDGSYEEADVVIYCTGYKYQVPCLTPECGIDIEDNWFKYLYHHCINIQRPSMAIIGLPYGASLFPLVNLQARYYMAYLAKQFTLPNHAEMFRSVMDEYAVRRSKNIPDRAFHSFPDCGRALSTAMAKEARITPTPNVIFNIIDALHKSWNDSDTFEIIDDDNFIRKPTPNS